MCQKYINLIITDDFYEKSMFCLKTFKGLSEWKIYKIENNNTFTNYNELLWAKLKYIFDHVSQSLDIANKNSVFFQMAICSYQVLSVFWPLNPVEKTSGILTILVIRFTQHFKHFICKYGHVHRSHTVLLCLCHAVNICLFSRTVQLHNHVIFVHDDTTTQRGELEREYDFSTVFYVVLLYLNMFWKMFFF